MAENKYSGKAEHPLERIEKRTDVSVKEMLDQLAQAEATITTAILRCKNPAYIKEQTKLYEKIRATYNALSKKIDEALKADVEDAAIDAYHRLEDELGESVVRWDEERAKRYWQYVAPDTSKSLAAVYTDNMSDGAITSLRQALIETERQAAIEGWSMNEKQKAVQQRWANLCSKPDEFFFVDRSGKVWEHARYLQMLTRTTAQRVYNDSYLDRVAENGINLVKIDSLGAPECEVCQAWQGVICSIDGKARGLPSIEDAKAAGVFHPNCVCMQTAILEEVDRNELVIQRKHPFNSRAMDLDAWEARKFAIDKDRYERQGMTAQEARTAVNRDNLEAAIRNGLLRADARSLADSLTAEQVAVLCPDNKCPRFEPLKKGDEIKIVRGSRGGVVHVPKNCTPEELQELINSRTPPKPKPQPQPQPQPQPKDEPKAEPKPKKAKKEKEEVVTPETIGAIKSLPEAVQFIKERYNINLVGLKKFKIDDVKGIARAVDRAVKAGLDTTYCNYIGTGQELYKDEAAKADFFAACDENPDAEEALFRYAIDGIRKGLRGREALWYGLCHQLRATGSVAAKCVSFGVSGIKRFNGIYINASEYKRTASDRESEVKSGWTAQGGDTIEGLMAHELGHALDNTSGGILGSTKLRLSNSEKFAKFIEEQGGLKKVSRKLSQYGATSNAETIAESWCEFTCSPNPRPLAKEVGNMLLEALRKD